MKKELIIVGAGPGGYTAAFHAADKGLDVTLIDQDHVLGGVCLNRGCIPSKALLHLAKIIIESRDAKDLGITFNGPEINIDQIRDFKNNVIAKLTGGLSQLAKQRKIEIVQGRVSFLTPNTISVLRPNDNHLELIFDNLILATGSSPVGLPFAPASDRIWDSSSALELSTIPNKLLVIGGGYIGLELATVYQALGSHVMIVEMTPTLLPGTDRDLSMILHKHAKKLFTDIKLSTKVIAINEIGDEFSVTFENANGESEKQLFDNILIAIGRKNNFDGLGLVNADISLTDDNKFINIDAQCQTSNPHIYAIGDLAGAPMLAHKAAAEAKIAVGTIAGDKAEFDPKAIPGVVFTDPEIAWCGLTEAQAKKEGRDVIISKFPWAASGRAVTLNRTEGVTKIIADTKTHKILGVAIAGPGAGELIAEGAAAIKNELTAEHLAKAIHPHPTLSETLMEAAEGIFGSPTHIYRKLK